MRLFLIPISTRRTLIYAQRINKITSTTPSRADQASAKAAALWLKWEKSPAKIPTWITTAGNKLFNTIPFQEWGLKSIPPMSARRKTRDIDGQKIDVFFPPSVLSEERIPAVLKALAEENRAVYRRRLGWCLVGMPITAPIGLLPVVPNIPFFYLAYRAFSYWRALEGSKHLDFLLQNSLLNPLPSTPLDGVYSRANLNLVVDSNSLVSDPTKVEWKDIDDVWAHDVGARKESLLIRERDAEELAQAVDIPNLVVECQRAARQVSGSLATEAQKRAQEIRLKEAEAKTEEVERRKDR